MTLVATTFKVLANYERRSLGMPEMPMAIVPYPMGGVSTEEAVQRSLAALNEMITGLTVQPAAAVTAKGKAGSGFDATMTLDDGSFDAVNRYFYEKRWGDGLPIVPPTQDLVQTMLRHTDLAPNKVLGKMGPSWNLTTVHHVAVNAVMAGCRPEYFPVVVAGIDAVLDPEFNIYGVQGTTNPAGVMLLVNGPIARELDINGGTNLFGQGWYANGTIGRAVRLCLMNIGGKLHRDGKPIRVDPRVKVPAAEPAPQAEAPVETDPTKRTVRTVGPSLMMWSMRADTAAAEPSATMSRSCGRT